MRLGATRYATQSKPVKVKPRTAEITHVSAPLKGLSLSSKLEVGDPLMANILVNFTVENDRIQVRSGSKKLMPMAGAQPIWTLVPYYASPQRMLAATNNTLCNVADGTVLKGGFNGNDWSWTSFSNLGVEDYTVMCNGVDGVWSWDGSFDADPAMVTVTSLSKSPVGGPAVCTVAPTDITKFKNGQTVVISGADASHIAANGPHIISSVGAPANTFSLVGVDTSGASGPQTDLAVKADPPGALTKENVTAPASATWVVPNQFNIVLAHQQRLWFADSANLAVYYLPVAQKSGAVAVVPLNLIFKRGGSIRAMATWTVEGGTGMNDQLAIFTSNGELAIYGGVDPATDMELQGVFRFDAPMSKNSVLNWGGDLYVLISTGLVPMTTLMKAESEQLGKSDREVISLFLAEARKYRSSPGWQAFINPSTGRMVANIPQGAPDKYRQLVRHMPKGVWSEYQDLHARCWAWLDPYVYFGDDKGNVWQMSPDFLNDDGEPITCDVQMAWSQFKTPGLKAFRMVKTYMISDGSIRPFVDIQVNYDKSPPQNQPDVSQQVGGSEWGTASWGTAANNYEDADPWAPGPVVQEYWNGVGRLGHVGAPRLRARVKNCQFAVAGWDVIYEEGAALG